MQIKSLVVGHHCLRLTIVGPVLREELETLRDHFSAFQNPRSGLVYASDRFTLITFIDAHESEVIIIGPQLHQDWRAQLRTLMPFGESRGMQVDITGWK